MFTWNFSISASEHAVQYYRGTTFESTSELPSLEKEIEHKCEANLSLENLFPHGKVVVYFGGLELFVNQSVASIFDTRGVLSPTDWNDIQRKKADLLSENSIEPMENQMSDSLALRIERVFPEFSVLREGKTTHSNDLAYSPLFNSRRDITVIRRQPSNTSGNTSGYIHFVDGVTVEAKKEESEKRDRFQLLAGMEITAVQIAKQKLIEGDLEKISVNGALLDYVANKGTLYMLTMDFSKKRSRVKKIEQEFTVSKVLSYLLSSI